jgi:hypothetical protein
LPSLDLPRLGDGETEPLRAPPEGAPVLLVPPVALVKPEPVLREFVSEGGAFASAFERWDARPLLIAATRSQAAELARGGPPAPVPFVIDERGALREWAGLDKDSWGLMIADRWGVLYHAVEARQPSELPGPAEVEEWVRFIAIQCPECGVIDDPTPGRWNPP